MALIICPECGKEISDKAILCPNCGYPIAEHFLEQRKNAKEKELLARIKPLEFQCPPSRVKVCVKCGKPFDIHYKPQCSCGFCGTEVDYPLQQLEFDDVLAELYILRHELPARNIGDNDSGEYQKMLQDVRDKVSALELYYKENGVTHYSFNPGPPSKVWYGTMEGYKSPSPMSGFSEFANAVASAREKGFSIICPVCHTGTNQVTDKTEACPICGHKEYVDFLVGRNGEFDQIVASTVHRVKKAVDRENSSLILVLPYLTSEFINNRDSFESYYDDIEVSAGAETKHFKAAIQVRNREMVDRSDLVIYFVQRKSGGAYQTIQYASRQGKECISLIHYQ